MAHLVLLFLALYLVDSVQAQPVQPPTTAKTRPVAKKPGPAKGVSTASEASGPCIGVFPLLGDRFSVKKIGLTVLGNEFKEISVDNWGLDDLAVERVRAAVRSGVVVRRIAHAKDAFAGYEPGIGLFQNTNTKAPTVVQQAAAQSHCERYVVITRAVSQYVGNQAIFGVGLVNSGRPILSVTKLHVMIRIHVHDGRTFAVLKSGNGSIGGSNFLVGPPTRKLDDSWWPEPPEAANSSAMREVARALLAEVIDKSIPEFLAP